MKSDEGRGGARRGLRLSGMSPAGRPPLCFGDLRCSSEFVEELQQGGQGPGLGLTAEGAMLAVLVGQLREALPWRSEETQRSAP